MPAQAHSSARYLVTGLDPGLRISTSESVPRCDETAWPAVRKYCPCDGDPDIHAVLSAPEEINKQTKTYKLL